MSAEFGCKLSHESATMGYASRVCSPTVTDRAIRGKYIRMHIGENKVEWNRKEAA